MVSAKLTPAARTRMRSSPALGVGSAASRTSRTSGPPFLLIQICFTCAPCLGPAPRANILGHGAALPALDRPRAPALPGRGAGVLPVGRPAARLHHYHGPGAAPALAPP